MQMIELSGYAIRLMQAGSQKVSKILRQLLASRLSEMRAGRVVLDVCEEDGFFWGILGKQNDILRPVVRSSKLSSSSTKIGTLSRLAPFCFDPTKGVIVFLINEQGINHADFLEYFALRNQKEACILWSNFIDDDYNSKVCKYFAVDLYNSYDNPNEVASSCDAYSTNRLTKNLARVSKCTRVARWYEKLINKFENFVSREKVMGDDCDSSDLIVFRKKVEYDGNTPVLQNQETLRNVLKEVLTSVKQNAFQ